MRGSCFLVALYMLGILPFAPLAAPPDHLQGVYVAENARTGVMAGALSADRLESLLPDYGVIVTTAILPPLRGADSRGPYRKTSGEKQDGEKSTESSRYIVEIPASSVSVATACTRATLEERSETVVAVREGQARLTTAFRPIEPGELRRIVDVPKVHNKMDWTAGAVQLIFDFEPAPGGATIVHVTARIIARGQTPFPLMRPSDWQRVPSNGNIERNIVAVLKAHCGTIRR